MNSRGLKTIQSKKRVGILISTIILTVIFIFGWVFFLYHSNHSPEVFYEDFLFWAAFVFFFLSVKFVLQTLQIAFSRVELTEEGILLKHPFSKKDRFFPWSDIKRIEFKKHHYSMAVVLMRSGPKIHIGERQFENYHLLVYSIKKAMKHDRLDF